MDPSRPNVPFLEAGPERAVRPCSDDDSVTESNSESNPVRVSGGGGRKESRLSFGATIVVTAPSWKKKNEIREELCER